MILSRHDTKILGGVSTGQSNGFPEAKQFRENTAKLLTLLGTTLIPKPPTILVASKILCDLQLPSKHLLFFFLKKLPYISIINFFAIDDLQYVISALDKLVSEKNTDEWELRPFGASIDNELSYAGALVIMDFLETN